MVLQGGIWCSKKNLKMTMLPISVHCLAHCVNLCLQDVAVSSQPIKALSFSVEMIQLIKYSPKRQVTFESIQKQQEYLSNSGIRTLMSN